MFKNKHAVRVTAAFGVAFFVIAAVIGIGLLTKPPETKILQQTADPSLQSGKVLEGANGGQTGTLSSKDGLVYESEVIDTNQPKTNLVGLQWDQAGPDGGSHAEVRVFDGQQWSDWVETGDPKDRKDNAPATHSAMVLTSNAKQIQYRFHLTAAPEAVTVSRPHLTFIDATQGPDPTKAGLAQKILGGGPVKAAVSGPRIFSRAEWGCPEPNSSNGWGPEAYYPLGQAIVHHTVTAGNPGSSAAEIRGIWQYHTYSNGWGDIGYNYLVDKNGNIFQGRYFNHAHAEAHRVDIEGGHTLGHNRGTTGIAALGDFTRQGATGPLLDGIANIAAFKLAKHGVNPAGAMGGHRDFTQTSCPGPNLYPYLPELRSRGANYYQTYYFMRLLDYSYVGQGVNGSPGGTINLRAGETANVYLDLRNEGEQTWSNTGGNPIRLGTANPLGHNSSLANPDWIAPSRPATFSQKVVNGTPQSATTVAPGEVARFSFTIKAPVGSGGTVHPYYQPISEGFAWFPRFVGVHWIMNITPDIYQYQYLQQSNNVPTHPGTSVTTNVTIKNTGNVSWSNTGANPLRLGTELPKDRASQLRHVSWLGASRVGTFAGKAQLDGSGQVVRDGSGNVIYDSGAATIAPGEAAHFVFQMTTPSRPYVANEYFNFVAEGKAWLNNVGLYWPVNLPQNYHAQWVGQSSPVTIDKSDNPIGSFYFDFKNTGSYVWNKGDHVRLAPSNPLDRTSMFAALGLTGGQLPTNTANWLNGQRVGSFVGKVTSGSLDTGASVINPGETARFMIALDARNVPSRPAQPYHEYFRLVSDGFAWLEDYGAYAPITVQD